MIEEKSEFILRFKNTQKRCVIVKRTGVNYIYLLGLNNHNKNKFNFFIHAAKVKANLTKTETWKKFLVY